MSIPVKPEVTLAVLNSQLTHVIKTVDELRDWYRIDHDRIIILEGRVKHMRWQQPTLTAVAAAIAGFFGVRH